MAKWIRLIALSFILSLVAACARPLPPPPTATPPVKPTQLNQPPSFDNLAVLPMIVKGHLVADLVAILASVDIVLGDIDR